MVDALAAAGSAAPRIDGVGTAACPLGRGRVQAVPAAITLAKPYPVEALFLHGTDPLAALPGRQAWVAALHQVPFVVSFTSWLDQSARQADLVLPTLPLESLDLVRVPRGGRGGARLSAASGCALARHAAGRRCHCRTCCRAGRIGWPRRCLGRATQTPWRSRCRRTILADMKEKGGGGAKTAKCRGLSPRIPTPSRKFEILFTGDRVAHGEDSQTLRKRHRLGRARACPPGSPPDFPAIRCSSPCTWFPTGPLSSSKMA